MGQITSGELEVLEGLQEEEFKKFEKNTSKAKGWLSAGDFSIQKDENLPLIASNAIVASAILNSDVAITKR